MSRRRRLGALELGCACPARTIGGLPTTITRADVVAALPPSAQGAYLQAQQKWDQSGAADAAAGAADLVSGGFDPGNPADQQKIVHAIAGAVSVVPGVGPILGGVIEAMNWVGSNVLAPALNKLLGYCTNPAGCCSHTGTWTYAQVAAYAGLSAPTPGTFAALAVPALVQSSVDAYNCKPSFSRAAYSILLPGLVALWNTIAGGPTVDYFVPRLQSLDAPALPAGWATLLYQPAITQVVGPLVYPQQAPYAFLPLAQVPTSIAIPGGEGQTWTRLRANAGPLLPVRAGRVVALHFGPPAPSKASAPARANGAAPGPSSAGTVATVAGAGAAGVLVWWLAKHGWRWVAPRWSTMIT